MEGYKLLITFVLMIFLLWRQKPITFVLLSSSVLLGLLYRTGLTDFIIMVWRGMANAITLELAIVLILIMFLESLLRKEKYLDRMLCGLQTIIPNQRLVMGLLPSFIGLMPSAGGAIFSAPLVEQAAKNLDATPEQKSFVNFYYRHVTEYFLPIYPNLLFAAHLTGMPIQKFILGMIPFGILVVLMGIPTVKKIPLIGEKKPIEEKKTGMGRELFFSTLPILVVVFLVLVVQTKVWLAVGVVLVFLFFYHRYPPVELCNLVRNSIKPKTIVLVFVVMIFKQVLEDTNAVNALPALFGQLPVPLYLIFTIINFLIGLMTGNMTAVVGIGFPIALTAMGAGFDLQTAVLLFMAGLTGQMLTPLHLCLTLTVDFFKADLNKVIKMLVGPELTILFIALVVYNIF